MDSSTASTRNAALAVLLAAAALPACGRAETPAAMPQNAAHKEAKPMTEQDAATRHAQAGQTALAAKDYQAANAAFDEALKTLGEVGPAAGIDDTGMQLVLAKSKADKGDWEGAAKTKGQVVRARLAQHAR